ncbi:MAG: hypothetical protein U0V74_15270 [Chitinophagales bacterium]
MRAPFCFILLILLSGLAFGQSDYRDVVYFKDGRIIKGVINEQTPGVSIKLQTAESEDSVTEYSLSEIDRIKREKIQVQKASSAFNLDSATKKRLAGYIDIGGLFGFKANDENGRFYKYTNNYFTITATGGYYVSRSLFLGAGAAIEGDKNKYFQIPIFANIRYTILRKRVSPYLDQKLGAAFLILPVNKNYRTDGVPIGGATLQTQLGVRVLFTNRVSAHLGVLYRFQHFRGNILINESYRVSYYSAAHYAGLVAGIMF